MTQTAHASFTVATAQEGLTLDELMRRIKERERAAFAELYRKTSAKLLGIIYRIVREKVLAEDILHDSYIKIWERAGDYDRKRGAPLAWITAIARNHALDQLRKRPRLMSTGDLLDLDDLPGENIHPLEQRIEWENSQLLLRCLDSLEGPKREMVVLAYKCGATREQLAGRFNMPVATVKTWLRRSLESLRLCLSTNV